MAKIFISYRRDDSAGHAGRLYDSLVREYGADQVFIDRVDIAPGADFADVIAREASRSDVILAVIGRRWCEARDERGRRRLDDPMDYVRREIEAGLRHGERAVAVLVDGAAMPREAELPPTLRALAKHNAVELSDSRWPYDLAQLVEVLGPLFGLPQRFAFEPRMLLIPEGEFVMGADPAADPYAGDLEQPQHRLTLPDYYIAKRPISLAQFTVFLKAAPEAVKARLLLARGVGRPGSPPTEGDFVLATRFEALEYCRWLSGMLGRLYRLPNEAEWEKAVRGTDGRIYPWGDGWAQGGRDDKRGLESTSPFGLRVRIGSPEWVWTLRSYREERVEPAGLLARLRFREPRTVRRLVTNYPYDPKPYSDGAWRRLIGSAPGILAYTESFVWRGGESWSAMSARCTARRFTTELYSERARFRVAFSRRQVSVKD